MYLLFLVLNKTECLNRILESFLKIGIKGATVVDSIGMGQAFRECESPVIGGLRSLVFNQCRPSNKTIFSVVESKEKVELAIGEIEKIIGPLGKPGTGILFAFPLDIVKGLTL